jgi:transposase
MGKSEILLSVFLSTNLHITLEYGFNCKQCIALRDVINRKCENKVLYLL